MKSSYYVIAVAGTAWLLAAACGVKYHPGETAAPAGATFPFSVGYNWEVVAEDDVGPVADAGRDNVAFALDGRGEPHFVYVSTTYNETSSEWYYYVKYARRAKGKWLTETVPLATPPRYNSGLTVKLDARGNPAVAFVANRSLSAYVRDQRRTLTVARRTKKGWSLTDIESPVFDVSSPSLALDARGNPHVAYSREEKLGDPTFVCYASWTGDRWLIEPVGDGVRGGTPSLALDARDRPHISYSNGGTVAYGHRTDAGWELYAPEEKDPDKQVSETSIAVDAAARPYIAYYGGDNDLKVRFQTDKGWEAQTVDEEGNVGLGCSLALDGDGYPYIAYRSRYDVKFAHWTGDRWFVQTVAYGRSGPNSRRTYLGGSTAMALDGNGVPQICFTGEERGAERVYLASWRGGEWRLPPGGEPEVIPDFSADMKVIPWGPEVAALRAGELWPTATAVNMFDEAWALYASPTEDVREEPRKIGEIPPATAVEIVDGKSVWTTFVPTLSEYDEAAAYFPWLRVRGAGKEGWLEARAVAAPDALVRFAEAYAPLREGPSTDAPALRPEEMYGDGSGWGSDAAVAAGKFLPLNGRCGYWLAVGVGWLPAATPGLEFYVRTFTSVGEEGADYDFYLPVGDDVARVLYSVWGPFFAPYLGDHAVVTITTRDGRSYDVFPERRVNLSWHETVYYYSEAVLAEPVKRADIVAVTFTQGEKGERVRATVDPRPAWAGK